MLRFKYKLKETCEKTRRSLFFIFCKMIKRIKSILNNIKYRLAMIEIMSQAMEYDLEPEIVKSWLDANYQNHYADDHDK